MMKITLTNDIDDDNDYIHGLCGCNENANGMIVEDYNKAFDMSGDNGNDNDISEDDNKAFNTSGDMIDKNDNANGMIVDDNKAFDRGGDNSGDRKLEVLKAI